MTVSARAVCVLTLAACLLASPFSGDARAQYFGRNKVEYRGFNFQTLRTDHFDIYYYPREEAAARQAARMAERWYARLSHVLGHTFSSRQPIILYGSHPEFSQTNVISEFLDESVGGVTESIRRRIVLPFAPGLAETDHVIGHELVHAFQMDILRKQKRPMLMPLWFAEGMAEYLSVGADDPLTAAWIRDAAERDALPSLKELGRAGASPYRFGQALWAYLAGRFGDDFIRRVLECDEKGGAVARIARVAGVDAAALSDQWHAAVRKDVAPAVSVAPVIDDRDPVERGTPLMAGSRSRLNLAPALSPDGRRIAILSVNDLVSVDLIVADTANG